MDNKQEVRYHQRKEEGQYLKVVTETLTLAG